MARLRYLLLLEVITFHLFYYSDIYWNCTNIRVSTNFDCLILCGNMIEITKSMYSGKRPKFILGDISTNWMGSNNGVRQGYTLLPLLFSIYTEELAARIGASGYAWKWRGTGEIFWFFSLCRWYCDYFKKLNNAVGHAEYCGVVWVWF